jgi:defect-in-organelle-trafficking protein DotD
MHPAETVAMPAPLINPPLDRAANKVANAWHLQAVENAAVHPPLGGSLALPSALSRTVPIAWTGPIAPLVHKLSTFAGYRLHIQGKTPPADIIVHISGSHTLFDDFREAAVQAGSRADLTVNATTRTVKLRYLGS